MEHKCEILCLNCHKRFPSPIQFDTAQAFFREFSAVKTNCPHCGAMTLCHKPNMLFAGSAGTREHNGSQADTGTGK